MSTEDNVVSLNVKKSSRASVGDVRDWFKKYVSDLDLEDATSVFKDEPGELSFSLFTEAYEYFIMAHDPGTGEEDAFISCHAGYRCEEMNDEDEENLEPNFMDVLSEENFILMLHEMFKNEIIPTFIKRDADRKKVVGVVKDAAKAESVH